MSEMSEISGVGMENDLVTNTMTKEKAKLTVQEIDQHNVQDVLQQSLQQPLVLMCWSARSEASSACLQLIQRLVSRFSGRIGLATLDCDAHPMLAQQLGAMQVPVAKVVAQGQILAEFTGQEPEDQLVALFTQLAGGPPSEAELEPSDDHSEMDQFLNAVEQKRQAGDLASAQQALETALADMAADAPELEAVRLKLGQILVESDQFDAAETLVDQFKSGGGEGAKLSAMIYFGREKALVTETAAELQAKIEQTADDPAACFGLAVYAVFDGDFAQARDGLMRMMLKARNFGDGKPQKALVALLDLMGPEHPEAKGLRRKLFSLLH